MALIDPEGLFSGDRMEMLSDEAKLYWPYFWCASNTVGRIELSYRKILGRVFHHFKTPPSEERFWSIAREYRDCYLLFIYKRQGVVWGQWDTSERFLPKYKLTTDERTPPPPPSEFAQWKNLYISAKEALHSDKSNADNIYGKVLGTLENLAEISAQNATERRGIGSGIGSGEEKEKPLPLAAALTDAVLTPHLTLHRPQPVPIEGETKDKPLNLPPIVEPYATAIHGRHVARKCSVRETKELLVAILKSHPKVTPMDLLEQIDKNHRQNCVSHDWTKDGGTYCPGLDKWLNPKKEKYLIDVGPPARASPAANYGPDTPSEMAVWRKEQAERLARGEEC